MKMKMKMLLMMMMPWMMMTTTMRAMVASMTILFHAQKRFQGIALVHHLARRRAPAAWQVPMAFVLAAALRAWPAAAGRRTPVSLFLTPVSIPTWGRP